MMYPQSRAQAASQALSAAIEQPDDLVLLFLGNSITYGGGAATPYPLGWRLPLQRTLAEAGINFRCLGRAYGALNAAGATNGRNPNVADYHQTPIFTPRDSRHWGCSGYPLSKSIAITNVNTGTGYITAPSNGMTNGEPFVFASTGAIPTFSVTQGVYYATSVNGAGAGTFQVSQYDGGTTPLTILNAGSGSLSLALGLVEMLPGIAQTWDVQPTDIFASGGTNDIIQLINTGVSVADTVAFLKATEPLYRAGLDLYAPNARKYRPSILHFYPGAANHENCTLAAMEFNEWLEDVHIPALGPLWTYIDIASEMTAPMILDGVHPNEWGYDVIGVKKGRSMIQVVGHGNESARVPREPVKRAAQPWVELSATTHRGTFGTRAGLAPGANSFFALFSYIPFELGSGLNVMVQQESPYQDGCVVGHNAGRLVLYWKSAGACIPPTAYTTVMQKYYAHRIMAFFDAARQEASLFCNGRRVQTVYTTAAAITSQDGWTIGAFSGLSSALGLYQDFMVGHGVGLDGEGALKVAEEDFFLGKTPKGVTDRFYLNEGTGTSFGGHGVLSGGTWVPSGLYLAPWNHKYVKPYMQRTANVTGTYTAVPGETVHYDLTAGGGTLTVPGGLALGTDPITLAEVAGSTNILTVVPATGTINGGANITVSAAGARTRIVSRGSNLITSA